MEENQKNDNDINFDESDNQKMQDLSKQYQDIDDSIFYMKQDIEHPAFQDIDNIIAQLSSQANQEEAPAEFSEQELQEELTNQQIQEEVKEAIQEEVKEVTDIEIQQNNTESTEESQTEQQQEIKEAIEIENSVEKPVSEEATNVQQQNNPIDETHSKWEEISKDNLVVKKYIVYISKDFIPLMDKMTTDERTAYINDAIQQKLDKEDAKKQLAKKQKLILHLVVAVFVAVLISPLALFTVHKAIMATFENYRYSQENFEKLYKQRFERDRAYVRSVQYNKEMKDKLKK